MIGRSLGEFALRERIGEGGFGVVYRAQQSTLDREAVVKVLHANLRKSKGIVERFLREAKLASKLDHPYAAHIYAFGVEPTGELWIAMELVRGTPLDQILKFQGRMPLERFVPLLERIAEVVHTAHEQGIVHRDLKPANVMVLSRAGRLLPKLLDFGIAKGLQTEEPLLDRVDDDGNVLITQTGEEPDDEDPDTDVQRTRAEGTPRHKGPKGGGGITRRGMIVGSPHYMAPEQWIDPRLVDARTDQYALGVFAYECLTDTMPFNGITMTEIEKSHKTKPVPSLGPGFPDGLDKVMARVLAKRPEDRYADVMAFAADFRRATGLSNEVARIPSLDRACRDTAIAGAPAPIADAVASLAAARNVHQARDRLLMLVRTIVRYLALLALACRARGASDDDTPAVAEALRELYRRTLADLEWLDLVRHLTAPWMDRRDAYPIPELVDMFHTANIVSELEGLASLPAHAPNSDEALFQSLESALSSCSKVLAVLTFLDDYPLVISVAPELGERWVGARTTSRASVPIRGRVVAAGLPVVLDRDGVPVVTLAPLVQAAAPTPGAPIELFLFEGRDVRGAKLTSPPAGFEMHDDGVWDYFRVHLSASFGDAEGSVRQEVAPYRGLQAFSSSDSAAFVGRERQVDAFVNRLRLQPLLAVVGRSGAGKSSFVHAGVIPAMHGWRSITMRPGAAPVAALAARLEQAGFPRIARDQLAADKDYLGELLRRDAFHRGPLVLVIDQLEEMFALCNNTEDRRVFAEAIAAAARAPDDPVRVIFTLRDDFLVRTEQVPAMRNRIGHGLQLLTVPNAEDMVRILVEPARRAGYEFEDNELPQEMVRQLADQPGALALLSFTAAKLWELRDRQFRQLTRAAYERLGGVGGALARHADLTLDEMPAEERGLARQAFRQLVTSQSTRAVLKRKDLQQMLGSTEAADNVIEKLVSARLLVASENEAGAETVEIVHEALLVAWPRLVQWRREDADGARFRDQLRAAAKQWDEKGRGRDLLWRGNPLAEYQQWRFRHPGPLTDIETAFTNTSLEDANRRARRRRLLLAGSFGVLTIGIVGLLVLNTRVSDQRRLANEAAARAEKSEANAKANADMLHENLLDSYEAQARGYVLVGDYERALTYLEEARKLGASGPGVELLSSYIASGLTGLVHRYPHDAAVIDARFNNDGSKLVTAGVDGRVRIWNVGDGKLFQELPKNDIVTTARFTADGNVLFASDTTAVLWDVAGAKKLAEYDLRAPDVHLWEALMAPDGHHVLTVGNDDRAWLWDVSGRLVGAIGTAAHTDTSLSLARPCAFAPDSSRVVCGDHFGTLRAWDMTGKLVATTRGHTDIVNTIEFSRDGTRIATASEDHSAVVWDAATVKPLVRVRHDDTVNGAVFSPDGRYVATASNDRTAKVWDARSGVRLLSAEGHIAGVNSVAFSPDGKQFATVADDSVLMLWDSASGRRQARLAGHDGAIYKVHYDPTGEHIVTHSHDKSAIVWSPQAQQRAVRLAGHDGRVNAVQLTADGGLAATGGADGTARLWDPHSGLEKRRLGIDGGPVNGVAFTPDAKLLATCSGKGIHLWNPATGAHVATVATTDTGAIEWSSDGKILVAADVDGVAKLYSREGELLRSLKGHTQGVASASFSPKADRVVTTSTDHTIRVWRTDTGDELLRWDTPFIDAHFDPSGQYLLALSDLEVEVWKVDDESRKPIARMKHDAEVTSARWSSKGDFVVTSSIDGTLRVWDRAGHLLVILRDGSTVQWGAQFFDNDLFIASFAQNGAVIWELPPAVPSFEKLARCKHYELRGNQLVPTDRQAGCQ